MGRGSAPFRQSAGFQPVKGKKLRRNPLNKTPEAEKHAERQ
jgi:hypothetical protein